MNSYILTLVIKNDVDEKARVEILDAVKKNFDELKKEDLWGTRSLSYPILHQEKGFYAHYEFQADPKKIAPLDHSMKLHEDILRYLLLRTA